MACALHLLTIGHPRQVGCPGTAPCPGASACLPCARPRAAAACLVLSLQEMPHTPPPLPLTGHHRRQARRGGHRGAGGCRLQALCPRCRLHAACIFAPVAARASRLLCLPCYATSAAASEAHGTLQLPWIRLANPLHLRGLSHLLHHSCPSSPQTRWSCTWTPATPSSWPGGAPATPRPWPW